MNVTKEKFIEKSNKIHNNKYDYSKAVYQNTETKVCIICPEHGEFWQTPHNHLCTTKPQGCPKCGKEQYIIKNTKIENDFINECVKRYL